MNAIALVLFPLAGALVTGCAQEGACGCPAVGGPILQTSVSSLQFDSATAAAQSLSITYGGPASAVLHETDDCATGAGAVAAIGSIAKNFPGSASLMVTPVAAGTCTVTLRFASRAEAVPITVL